jgi:TetR/AcrR family transcriptional regulator
MALKRRRPAAPDSRTRILAAAGEEFGARGFAATTVDRIARRARVNKAMIYYHFPDKRALYAAIVRELYTGVVGKLRAIASESLPLNRKLDKLIESLVHSVDASTHFLPIFLREIADGAVHLGPEELALIVGIFTTVSGVIVEGGKQHVFQPVHPALAHFTLVGPLIMFRATAPVRARIKSVRHVEIPDVDSATLVRHLQMVAQRMLAPGTADGGGRRAETE